ncbi:MAG: bacillithiol biosynthesis cysteine-adding enzyme BshC [Candidatus Bathyarchaeota archaeon]|nr:MAG: bacillithiol biosynthesis cysteine-adding enzyme BshC [Candidatus Bathyarchaeota archaeon]
MKEDTIAKKSSTLPLEFVTSRRITIDYINHADKIMRVFRKHFREPTPRKLDIDRERLVDRLLNYNKKLDAPNQVVQNIESLSQTKTQVVVTGQQPCLFSGPLYTIYKAISTIVICERLSTPKYPLVPIFWNASEDHDFSEVDHINIFMQNKPYKISYDYSVKGIALAQIRLDKSELNKMLTMIADISPDSEFKTDLLRKSKEIIEKSFNIGDFFSRFMTWLFGESGLIMMEPHYFRDLMTSVFDKLIRHPAECTQILNRTGLQLEKLGYSPRIHKKSNICNFFLLNENGERMRITFNGKFQALNESFSQRELLDLLESTPSRFSANALTRPITQDLFLPTFAYVAGPNEIAYQAQLRELYDFFSIETPVLFPRFGATIVEKKISRVLKKYSVEIHQLKDPAKLMKELAKKRMENIFNSFKNEISRNMSEVTQEAGSIDKALIEPCTITKGRIFKTIEALEDKIASKVKRHNMTAQQQIMKAHNNLFPNNQLQERQVNAMEYIMKFGKTFLTTVYESFLEADYGEHKVINC